MGRHKSEGPQKESIHVRLLPDQIEAFDRVVAARAEALRGQGVEVTRTTVLRSLIERAIEEEDPAAKPPKRKGTR